MTYKPQTPKNPSGVFRTIVLGRVSTPQQQESNIQASYDYVRPIIKQIYDGPSEVKELGEQGSGMLTDRATILEASAELETGQWDLVLMEDLSKAYRNPRWQAAFVQDAVDLNTRVICPGDQLDTFEDNWEVTLAAATIRHGLHIPDTRRRVRRTADYSFRHGGMVQKVRYGYRKLSKEEAASGQFGPQGLRIAKLPECTPVIQEIRRRLLENLRPMMVVNWLNEHNIKPGPYVRNGRWTVAVLRDTMCDPLLSGTRTFRKTRYRPIFKTGKHKRETNREPLSEQQPELAHLDRQEQDSLLQAMGWSYHQRSPKPRPKSPRRGVPREQTLWPGQGTICAACGERMHLMGEYLKCRNVCGRYGQTCWNHVQVPVKVLRAGVLGWLVSVVSAQPAVRATLVDWLWEVVQKACNSSGRFIEALQRHIDELVEQEERIARAIVLGGNIPSFVEQAGQIRQKIKKAKDSIAKAQGKTGALARFQTKGQFAEHFEEGLLMAAGASCDVGKALRTIIPDLVIHPVQALDSGLVRPRAKVTLRLAEIMKENQHNLGTIVENLEVRGVLDLFTSPSHIAVIPQYLEARASATAKDRKLSGDNAAKILGVNRMTIKRACDYLHRMKAEETTELYRELHDRPEHASRWKPRQKD